MATFQDVASARNYAGFKDLNGYFAIEWRKHRARLNAEDQSLKDLQSKNTDQVRLLYYVAIIEIKHSTNHPV